MTAISMQTNHGGTFFFAKCLVLIIINKYTMKLIDWKMSKTVSRQHPLLIDDTINYVILPGYIVVWQMLFKEMYRKGTVQSTCSQQSEKSAGGAVNTT